MGLDHSLSISGDPESSLIMRKENWIQGWMEREFSEYVDINCLELTLTIEQAERLLRDLETVVKNQGNTLIAWKHMPPVAGFFYGNSTDLDEYYWESVNRVYDWLNDALQHLEEGDEIVYWCWY